MATRRDLANAIGNFSLPDSMTEEDIEHALAVLDDIEQGKYKKDCECGAEATYGKDATHSTWCPKRDVSTFSQGYDGS